jgi:hypothetical protein
MDELFYIAEDLGLKKSEDYEVKVENHSATFSFTDKGKAQTLRDSLIRNQADGMINVSYLTNLKKSANNGKYSFKITIQ